MRLRTATEHRCYTNWVKQTNWGLSQLQSVIDHFSLGKIIRAVPLERRNLLIRPEDKQIADSITGKLITQKNELPIEELYIRTNHGLFYVLVIDPLDYVAVFQFQNDWLSVLLKKLQLKNIKIGLDGSGKEFICHHLDKYFYLFVL